MTGAKVTDKVYTRITGYPGGVRQETFQEAMEKHPERVIEHAVKGMLPKNTLGRQMAKKLKVYVGPEHPHQAQNPRKIDLGGITHGQIPRKKPSTMAPVAARTPSRAFASSPAPARSPLTSATPRITSAARRSSSTR